MLKAVSLGIAAPEDGNVGAEVMLPMVFPLDAYNRLLTLEEAQELAASGVLITDIDDDGYAHPRVPTTRAARILRAVELLEMKTNPLSPEEPYAGHFTDPAGGYEVFRLVPDEYEGPPPRGYQIIKIVKDEGAVEYSVKFGWYWRESGRFTGPFETALDAQMDRIESRGGGK
jgi:hypothetical protein